MLFGNLGFSPLPLHIDSWVVFPFLTLGKDVILVYISLLMNTPFSSAFRNNNISFVVDIKPPAEKWRLEYY